MYSNSLPLFTCISDVQRSVLLSDIDKDPHMHKVISLLFDATTAGGLSVAYCRWIGPTSSVRSIWHSAHLVWVYR